MLQASRLKRLALYFDVGTQMWQPKEDWQQLLPQAWEDLFQPGIAAEQSDTGGGSGAVLCAVSVLPCAKCTTW